MKNLVMPLRRVVAIFYKWKSHIKGFF